MTTVYLDLRPAVEPDHVERLHGVISRMNPNDQVTLIVERSDAHQTDSLLSVLEQNGLDYMVRSWHDGSYHITARPRKGNR